MLHQSGEHSMSELNQYVMSGEKTAAATTREHHAATPDRWIDELVRDWMGTVGEESTQSRVNRTLSMVHDGLADGLAESCRDLPKSAGSMIASCAESAVAGVPLSMLPVLGAETFGYLGACGGTWLAVGCGVALPAIPKLQAMREAVMDYWNHPENRDYDKQRVQSNASVVLDTAARFAGLSAGGQLAKSLGLHGTYMYSFDKVVGRTFTGQ
jgi:hypothetical protein